MFKISSKFALKKESTNPTSMQIFLQLLVVEVCLGRTLRCLPFNASSQNTFKYAVEYMQMDQFKVCKKD